MDHTNIGCHNLTSPWNPLKKSHSKLIDRSYQSRNYHSIYSNSKVDRIDLLRYLRILALGRNKIIFMLCS